MANDIFIGKVFKHDLMSIIKESENRGTQERTDLTIWPSEAMCSVEPFSNGECRRSVFYRIMNVPQSDQPSVRNKYICEAGLMYERYHIEKFKGLNIFIEEQKRLQIKTENSNKIIISGKVDCIIEDNGIKKAIEMKTVSSYKADEIFGANNKIPLPAANNLMQAMLYKHYFKNTEEGKASGVEEVYLMYINRGDGATFYYKIDLDEEGYPILTAITQGGKEVYCQNVKDFASYQDIINGKVVGDSESSRMASLRFTVYDILEKCDSVYTYVKNETLPPTDYKIVYNLDDVQQEYHCGRISKIKYNKATKQGEMGGDFRCGFCGYQKKCLKDSGIELK